MALNNMGVRHPNQRAQKKGRMSNQFQQPYDNVQPDFPIPPQMYDPRMQQAPTDAYYGSPYSVAEGNPVMGGNFYGGNMAPAGQPFLADPMANVAMAYGQSLMGHGKQLVDQKLEKYVPISKLKYYFAVDTTYVRRKISLLLFPFLNSDWSIKYNQDEPVAPRYEVNAPDLYIPVMAFVTFILMAGVSLGTQNKFSPEQLGTNASFTLGWLVLEVIVLLLTSYLMNIQTDLGYLDFLAFSSYKYVGMILSVCGGLMFLTVGYYVTLLYTSIALCFFLVKTLRIQVLPKSVGDHTVHGNKRRMYLLLCIAVIQPFIMFWLTHHLIPKVESKASGAHDNGV